MPKTALWTGDVRQRDGVDEPERAVLLVLGFKRNFEDEDENEDELKPTDGHAGMDGRTPSPNFFNGMIDFRAQPFIVRFA